MDLLISNQISDFFIILYLFLYQIYKKIIKFVSLNIILSIVG